MGVIVTAKNAIFDGI